jgi:hypothetical protein
MVAHKALVRATSSPGIAEYQLASSDLSDGPFQSASTRLSATATTGSLAASATTSGTITLSKTANVLSIGTNYPAWVRLYDTDASRIADNSRAYTTFPTAGTGVIADTTTTAATPTVYQSPTEMFVNNDSPITTTCYYAIKNMDTVSRTIGLTVVYLPIEL